MSFLRPEAVAFLTRWKETIVFSLMLAFALSLMLRGFFGDRIWLLAQGAVLAIPACALLVFAVTKARLRGATTAPGVVEIDEGKLTYWSDFVGGSVALSEVSRISLTRKFGATFWLVESMMEAPLEIPTNAKGGDRLVEVIATLPGANVEKIARALRQPDSRAIVIWEKRR